MNQVDLSVRNKPLSGMRSVIRNVTTNNVYYVVSDAVLYIVFDEVESEVRDSLIDTLTEQYTT